MMEVILRGRYALTKCSSYQDLLSMLPGPAPHLILLDLNLKSVTAEELMHPLRRNEATRNTPVVLMSGAENTSSEAERLGCVGHLLKPFSVEQLRQLIAQHTAQGTGSE